MNTFKVIRLSIWSILLAVCAGASLLYLAISSTLLTQQGLEKIVKESKLAETVREEVLLPKILQTTKGSDYASLLDEKTVTNAFNQAVPADKLNEKLAPATAAMQRWLDSKEPELVFQIDMSELSDDFAARLSENVDAKLASLPKCTRQNSLADAETGICQSSLVSKEALTNKISELIQTDATLKENLVLTPDSVGLSAATQGSAGDFPTYLNMYYAFAIITAGLVGMIALWLLFKHRLAGIVALGGAGLLVGIGLFISATVISTSAGTFSSDTYLQLVARTGTTLLESTLQTYALIATGIGFGLVIIGTISLILLSRRHKSHQTMHMSSSQE